PVRRGTVHVSSLPPVGVCLWTCGGGGDGTRCVFTSTLWCDGRAARGAGSARCEDRRPDRGVAGLREPLAARRAHGPYQSDGGGRSGGGPPPRRPCGRGPRRAEYTRMAPTIT